MAFYFGQKLTYDNVLNVLGAVDTEVFAKLLGFVLAGEVTSCIELIEELVIEGRELGQFVVDFTWYLRNLLLVKTSDAAVDIIDVSSENLVELKRIAKEISIDTLMRYIRIFSELANQVKYASQKRVLVEIAIIKLCKPAMETNFDSILNRLSLIESQLEKGIVVQNTGSVAKPQEIDNVEQVKEEEPERNIQLEKALPDDLQMVVKNWKVIINKASGSMKPMLTNARLSVGNDNQLLLVFTEAVDKDFVDKEEHIEELQTVIRNEIRKEVRIFTKLIDNSKEKQDDFPDLTKIIKNIEVEYEN
jgi:DNA polymerase-3 subunit gamma/tau